MSKAIYALAAVALLAASCSKEASNDDNQTEKATEENVQNEITRENIIGVHKITKVEGTNSGLRTDRTDSWFQTYAGECAKDDITEFKPDNSFVVLDGTIACGNSTDDAGTWSLINGTTIKIDADTTRIEAFTNTTLRIVSPVYSTAQGDVIFTYTRQ